MLKPTKNRARRLPAYPPRDEVGMHSMALDLLCAGASSGLLGSFITQRFNRIEARSPYRRVYPEDQTDCRRYAE
jgi:hypothetical protein